MIIRVENIECRFSQGRYEIIKWYPNTYYGAEERMIEEGYEKVEYGNGEWSMKKDYHSVTSSCFKNPESCYTIATLEYHKSESWCDMTTVGTRLLELKKKDRKAFFKVYKLAEKAICYVNRDSDDE